MALLWMENSDGGADPRELGSEPFQLSSTCGLAANPEHATSSPSAGCIRHAERDGVETWVLLPSGRSVVRVNGVPVELGLCALRDHDEILIGGVNGAEPRRVFFSTERRAQIQPFVGGDEVCCPRCKEKLCPEQPSVRCPCCGVWHHQDVDGQRPCWTYSGRCGACNNQPTALDTGYRWSPEEF